MENDTEFEEIVDRKNLAVVCRVVTSQPIPGKDKIEFLKIEGWTAVVQKGLYSSGDLVLAIRYDSLIPAMKCLEFLGEPTKGFHRIKTRRFTTPEGPVYSQVIVLSKKDMEESGYPAHFSEGDDWTDILKIKKWIQPTHGIYGSFFGKMKKQADFPKHLLSKTDEMNLQSKKKLLAEIVSPYYITVKLDGSSFTAFLHPDGDELTVCSRNTILKDDDNSFWKIAREYNLEGTLKAVLAEGKRYAIQGELCGPKIQKNRLGLMKEMMYVFNIIDLSTRKRIPLIDQTTLCTAHLLPHVPIIETNEIPLTKSIEDLLRLAASLKYEGTNNPIEGLVVRPQTEVWSERIDAPLSFKVMNPEYS